MTKTKGLAVARSAREREGSDGEPKLSEMTYINELPSRDARYAN